MTDDDLIDENNDELPEPRIFRTTKNKAGPIPVLSAECGIYSLSLDNHPEGVFVDKRGREVVYDAETDDNYQLWLISNRGKRKWFMVDLSMMTTDELRCFRDVVVESVEQALPAAEQADQQAMKEHKLHGKSNARLIRPISAITRPDGSVTPYMQGVRFRPQTIQDLEEQ